MGVGKDQANPPQQCLAGAAYAIRCGHHATHGCSPGGLAPGGDMSLPVGTPIGWGALKAREQKAIAKSNKRENSKREDYKYQKGDWITINS